MTPRTRLAVAALAFAALLPLAACGGGDPSPGTTEPGDGTLGTGTETSPAPPPLPEYPNSPLEYAQAVLEAWEPPADIDRLGGLSTPEVQEQLIEVPMPLDFNWHVKACVSNLPTWDCVFFNDTGDRQTIKIADNLLGEAHAAVEVALDLTEYPDSAVAYAREFADAWRDENIYRMRRLAEDSVADTLNGQTEPASGYRACGDGAAGSTYVRIYGGGGPEYVLQVTNQFLGEPNAISASVTPPDPPACSQLIIIPTIIVTLNP